MAKRTDLSTLVDRFTAELESAVRESVNQEVAARVEEIRRAILGGATPSAAARGAAVGRTRPGPRAGYVAALKPCPVCGVKNKARRFSYLCEKHRTPENLAQFKGSTAGKASRGKKKAGTRGRRGAAKKADKTAQASTSAPQE